MSIRNIRKRDGREVAFDQHALDGVLHLLNGGNAGDGLVVFHLGDDLLGQHGAGFMALGAAGGLEGGKNRLLDLLLVEDDLTAVALADVADAHVYDPFLLCKNGITFSMVMTI